MRNFKTLLFTVLITLFGLNLSAQITISGATGFDGTFTEYTNPLPPAFPIVDTGTKVYVRSFYTSVQNVQYVFRSNNYWHFAAEYYFGMGQDYAELKFKSQTQSNYNTPPCIETWDEYQTQSGTQSNTVYDASRHTPTGNSSSITITGDCSVAGQITVINMPMQSGTYKPNISNTGVGVFDAGTNYYNQITSQFDLFINQIIKRESNVWKQRLYINSASGVDQRQEYHLTLPATSSANEPPCGGVWEKWNDVTGVGTGAFHYVTINGGCSNVNNPPTPLAAGAMGPNGYQLPRYFDFEIPNIPNPQAGLMIWDITNVCVKVYNGTTWNCI